MIAESRTQDQVFNDWKATKPTTRWRPYWEGLWTEHIELYKKLDWKLICLHPREKTPVKDVHWDERTLTYENAQILAHKDMNLAVRLNDSGLMVIDWDTRRLHDDLIPYLDKTMSVITPRGWHIYFCRDREYTNKEYDKVRTSLQGRGDMFRGGLKPQYCLLPLDIVKMRDKAGNIIGRPTCYEWMNKGNLMSFSSFMEEFI